MAAIERPDEEQMLHYSSSKNITFSGTVPSGYSRAEWAELSDEDKDAAVEEIVWELIEIGPAD